MEDLLGDVKVLYEQGPCLLINKPGGLLTQAPPHIDSVEMRLKKFIRVRDQKPGRVYLAVPHRLDRPVTGVMVFALHQRAAKRISNQFQQRLVEKEYWACVEGRVESDEGTLIDFMRKVPGEARSEICEESVEQASGQYFITEFCNVGPVKHGCQFSWRPVGRIRFDFSLAVADFRSLEMHSMVPSQCLGNIMKMSDVAVLPCIHVV